MTERASDSETLIEVLAEAAKTGGEAHPELEQLLDYHTGQLTPEGDNHIQNHLVGCRRCAQILIDLALFAGAQPQKAVSDLTLAASLRDFETRRSAKETPVTRSLSLPVVYALAASLLLAVVGLSIWVSQLKGSNIDLRQAVAELSRPQINPPVVYVSEITRAGQEADVIVRLSPDQAFVLFVLVPGTLETFDSYGVELTDAAGREIWTHGELELIDSALRVRLPRQLLPEGDYRIKALGIEGESILTMLDSSLQVRYR